MKTNMKANLLNGIKILGLGALLFGATATVPAQASDRFGIGLSFNRGHVNTDLVFYSGPDRRPEGKFWNYDRHDHCWRRDRCR